MTITLDDVTARKKPEPTPEEVAALAVARRAPGAGPVPDRAGRAAEAADHDSARDRPKRGDH